MQPQHCDIFPSPHCVIFLVPQYLLHSVCQFCAASLLAFQLSQQRVDSGANIMHSGKESYH